MSHVEISRTGAAAARRAAKKNPMQVLVDIVDDDPTADANRLFRAWWRVVKEDEDYLEAVARHAFANFLTSLNRDKRRPKIRSKAAVERERAAVAKLTARLKNVVLMDLKLPNGKLLRNSTFAECGLAGGWFKMLATKGKPSEIVGKVLTEDDLRKMR